jgi:hypothetical protein
MRSFFREVFCKTKKNFKFATPSKKAEVFLSKEENSGFLGIHKRE